MEWGLMTIVGPILLVLVLAWSMLNNRRSNAEKQRTEDATRMRRAEEDAAEQARDPADKDYALLTASKTPHCAAKARR